VESIPILCRAEGLPETTRPENTLDKQFLPHHDEVKDYGSQSTPRHLQRADPADRGELPQGGSRCDDGHCDHV